MSPARRSLLHQLEVEGIECCLLRVGCLCLKQCVINILAVIVAARTMVGSSQQLRQIVDGLSQRALLSLMLLH